MRSTILSVIALLLATALSAAPVITSVTPNAGPAAGGTEVTIKGSGFETCPICSPAVPPIVYFGSAEATSTRMVDDKTLVVVTPAHPAATVAISIQQWNGNASLAQAFTFSGDYTASLEPVMIPTFSPTTRGSFGSEFATEVVAAHKGGTARILLYGHDLRCLMALPVMLPTVPVTAIEPLSTVSLNTACSSWPARIFWVPASQSRFIGFNVRVRDISRSDLSHGTEVPVVRLSDWTTDRIVLPNVPLDVKFRGTLRIYAREAVSLLVTIGQREQIVTLQPGHDEYQPAYAMVSIFPTPDQATSDRVRITVEPVPVSVLPIPPPPFWAMVSVTNNVTQEITTITPD